MTEAVLDTSVVLLSYDAREAEDVGAAHELRARHRDGSLRVLVPQLLFLEVINVAARRWGWSERALTALADALVRIGFDVLEPPLERVAAWAGRGLTAYDACYVALAESNGVPLVTTDTEILRLAAAVARPL